ncbi:hypothetical protein Tdes44962_MAKER09084 [Teratosphaeria destructans]|uniref:Uncharacterized protein n=1 Tax=Teratosphaeria destructans TaxID=418781 RepID=A0A9W7SV26_9PEZI|nr:hypothetical protein Tdes44962_MAKER09084 [Teratosphaeria destructans]
MKIAPSLLIVNAPIMASVLGGLFKRAPPAAPAANAFKFPYNIHTNPYRAQRTWPPDFTRLSEKHKFRLERRYRRRTKLKWARPQWVKYTKLAQWGTILFAAVYGTLFLDLRSDEDKAMGVGEETVFHGVRKWYREQKRSLEGARDDSKKQEG